MTRANNQKESEKKGWHDVAWAFLKPFPKGSCPDDDNTRRKLRLQLFKPCPRPKDPEDETRREGSISLRCPTLSNLSTHKLTSSSFRMVWGWWKDNRKKYPSSLYVTVQGLNPPKAGGEKMSSGEDEGLNTLSSSIPAISKANPAALMTPKIPVWSRLPGQNCKIPNCRQHGFEDAKFNQVPPRPPKCNGIDVNMDQMF